MIKEYKGDLLNSGCDIICHQVNLQGIMGGDLAKQIATKYPGCEEQYQKTCKNQNLWKLGGRVQVYKTDFGQYIANCFSQNEWFRTEYKWLKEIVKTIRSLAIYVHAKTIGIPKNYGCGIAIGNWKKVKKIWTNIFKDIKSIELQIWGKE